MIELIIAFGAGLISFLSPCVLPLIPGYISYISGSSINELVDKKNINLFPIILFIVGGLLIIRKINFFKLWLYSSKNCVYSKSMNFIKSFLNTSTETSIIFANSL